MSDRAATRRWDRFRPSRFRRGRLAAWVCGVYLALVAAALVVALLPVPDGGGASLGGVWLIFATAPLSMVLLPALTPVVSVVESGEPTTVQLALLAVTLYAGCVLAGLAQAAALWFLLRGRPREVVPASGTGV